MNTTVKWVLISVGGLAGIAILGKVLTGSGDAGVKVVTEKGETIPTDELQGKIFRIVDKDDASGYVVSPIETTGTDAVLCYLQAS